MTSPENAQNQANPAVPAPPVAVPAPEGVQQGNVQNPPAQENSLGKIALVVGIVGFVLACIPPILGIGLTLLGITLILAIVSLFQTGKSKKAGIAALILSVVGTIVGIVMLFIVVFLGAREELNGATAGDSQGFSVAGAAEAGASADSEKLG